jgi:hypothetical protein
VKPKIDIIRACNDPHLFKPLFKDIETWQAWMAFLKALFALPMTEQDLSLYSQCTGREALPTAPFKEAWVPTGRRSGKSFISALIAVYLAAFRQYNDYLAPGEKAIVACIAADRRQSAVIFDYCRAFLTSNAMLRKLVLTERAESIDLVGNVTLEVKTASYRSTRGPSYAAVICDEIAFWRSDEHAANPSQEVLRAIKPALGTIPNSLLLCISSPFAQFGPLWDNYNRHFGKNDSKVLIWNASTAIMNPTFSTEIIDQAMIEDPEAALSEYNASFRADLASYLSIEVIEAAVVPGRYELPPQTGIHYQAFCDLSGGITDQATLSIAHAEGDKIVLDLARGWKSPHVPAVVVGQMSEILRFYGLHRVVGDRYAAGWPPAEFSKNQMRYEPSSRDRSVIYLEFLPLMQSGRVELLDNKRLTNELRGLVRRARSGGRDTVDHMPGAHDDLANSVAGVCSLLGTKRRVCDSIDQFMI